MGDPSEAGVGREVGVWRDSRVRSSAGVSRWFRPRDTAGSAGRVHLRVAFTNGLKWVELWGRRARWSGAATFVDPGRGVNCNPLPRIFLDMVRLDHILDELEQALDAHLGWRGRRYSGRIPWLGITSAIPVDSSETNLSKISGYGGRAAPGSVYTYT